MAFQSNKPMSHVVRSGITLAFVSFPAAIAQMPGSVYWSILFFFMVLLLGLDTQFTVVEICTAALMDQFPDYIKPGTDQRIVTMILCCLFFLLGLPMMTRSGIYWVVLLDDYAGSWGLIFIAIVEVVSVSWFYGVDRFIEDIKMMLPEDSWFKSTKPIGPFTLGQIVQNIWKALWSVITPLTLIGILVWSVIDYTPVKYGDMDMPGWAHAIGWTLLVGALCLIPGAALRTVFKYNKESDTCGAAVIQSKQPNAQWMPRDPANRKGSRYGKPVRSKTIHSETHEYVELSSTELLAAGTNRIIVPSSRCIDLVKTQF